MRVRAIRLAGVVGVLVGLSSGPSFASDWQTCSTIPINCQTTVACWGDYVEQEGCIITCYSEVGDPPVVVQGRTVNCGVVGGG